MSLAVLFLQGALLAQATGGPVVHGTVQTEKGEPVDGARVEIRGLGISTATRDDGSFRLEDLKPGRYWITVTGGGIDPVRKAITLGADERVIDFHVRPVSQADATRHAAELDSLDRAFVQRRRTSLDGAFLTRDDIARSRQPQLGAVLSSYLIQTAPRGSARGGAQGCAPYESWVWQQVRSSGRSLPDAQAYPYISVNGARPFLGRALYEFDPDDVEALEFYRGAGPAFGIVPTSAQCGLIIVWTK